MRYTALIWAALTICLWFGVVYGADVVISEFMALNNSTLADGDRNSSDWIELHNPTDNPVNLSGWYLTDDPSDLTQWPFPDISIPDGGYLVVFASEQNTTDYVDSLGYLHTNFALKWSGEYLALVETEGATATVAYEYSPNFPPQLRDVSYGLSDEGAVSDETLVPSGVAISYRVPTAADAGADWTSLSYDDSAWVGTVTLPAAGLVIAEINTGESNWVEVQNVSTQPIDTSGWFVAVNDASSANINDVHSTVWNLPPSVSPGEVLYRSDSSGDNYWGSDIAWEARGSGWAMIVDDNGVLEDLVVWGYSESEIASLDISVNGFDNITAGQQWRGAAVASAPGEIADIIIVTADTGNESDYVNLLTDIYGPSSTVNTVAVLIDVGEEWKYFKGTEPPSEPANAWIELDLDDSNWFSGPTGIGYGDGDDATILDDMRYNYLSVFCRKEFEVADISSIGTLVLKIAHDDGFIAYLNGQEVGRKYMGNPGEVFTYDMASTTTVATLPESVEITVSKTLLREGRNVLAVQIHNNSLTSSDLSMIPSLVSQKGGTSVGDKNDLLEADLVIVSGRTSLAFYGADRAWWNETLSTPMMLHSPYLVGDEGWGWLGGDQTSGGSVWDVDDSSDLFDNVNVSGGQVMMFDPDPGYQVSNDIAAANGDVVAWYGNYIAVATWTTSQSFDNGDTPASDRVFFAAPRPALANMTQDGKQFLENSLTRLYAPESGSVLRRTGSSDTNAAGDFNWAWSPSKGTQNPSLMLPFTGHTFPAVTGIGFSDGQSGFEDAIRTDVASTMRDVNASLWTRIGFESGDLAPYTVGLTLRMKYDDGFVAYINGVKVAESNAPATPQWNSTAIAQGDDSTALNFQHFDITAFLSNVEEGNNVLAIHGLNFSAGDNDFLILPELIALKDPAAPRYMTSPTPGEKNVAGCLGVVADTRFSADRGFYGRPFYVEITTDTPGAEVRYTVDGSVPTATHGEVYTAPITITGQTILRAAAFKPGYLPTNVDTHTYIFLNNVLAQDNSPAGYPSTWKDGGGTKPADYEMDPDIVNDPAYRYLIGDSLTAIPSMSIVTQMDNLFDSSTGIYMNPQSSGVAWERPASVEFIDPTGAEEFQIDCGLRIQGGASRLPTKSPKHGFRLLFKGDYGDTKLRFPLFGKDATDEFDTVILRAGFNNSWIHWSGEQRPRAQYARDRFARNTQLAMGQPASHGRYVHLYLNGMYWGVYDLSERPTAPFMAAYYGGDKEEYDALNSGDVRDGDKSAWNTMMSIANGGLAGEAQYEAIQQYLDIDNLIDFIIVNHYGANHDWDGHNWYAGRKREEGAGYQFFCWDSERILEGVTDNILGVNNNDKPSRLYQQLRANAEFRMLFADHLHRHFFNDGPLTTKAAADRWREISGPMDEAIIAESARWGDYRRDMHSWSSGPYELYTKYDHYDVEQTRLMYDYFPKRSNEVMKQYRNAGLYPDTVAPVFNVNGSYRHGGLFLSGDELTIGAASVVYYTTDGTDPRLSGGGISPTATAFTAPVTLSESILIKSRAFNGGQWSALNEAVFVLHAPSTLHVTEIMYNPILGEEPQGDYTNPVAFEFIELKNTGDKAIGLAGVKLTEGIIFDFTTGDVPRLEPGEYVVVVKNLAAFTTRYPNWHEMNIAGEYEGSLANEGEMIEVRDGLSRTGVLFTYDDAWYSPTDGLGFSLVPMDPDATGDPSAKESWRASAYLHGSPGEEDPEPATPAILVNEVLTHPDLPEVNAIELYNPTPTDVDLGGWWLTDDADVPEKYSIAPGTIINAYGYLSILQDDGEVPNNPLSPEYFGDAFTLSSRGGEAYLYSPHLRYCHGFPFGGAENGASFGRYVTSTGEERFPAQLANTFGYTNAGPRIGPVVISEIMYHPADGDHEFLELANLSGSTVHLYHLDYTSNTWKVTGIRFIFPENVELPPGERLLLVRDTISAYEFRMAINIPASVEIFSYSGALDNAGEMVTLQKPGAPDGGEIPYIVVDAVSYDDAHPWPTEPDGDGPSLERVALNAYGDDVISWEKSVAPGGTPGGDSSTFDSDWDGMPDGWEVENGLDPLTPDASGDADADGQTNYAEYIAGTDPRDSSSVFSASKMSVETGTIALEWNSAPGKVYRVWHSDDLMTWTVISEEMAADGERATTVWTTPLGPEERQGYYRVEVLPSG